MPCQSLTIISRPPFWLMLLVYAQSICVILRFTGSEGNLSRPEFSVGGRCRVTGAYLIPDRAEINPQPRKSHAGQKLVIANQWVSSCNRCKSHLIKAEPAGQ